MKIIYFITASNHGRGGHYYSLLETASAVSLHEEVTIISIGIKESPVLEQFQGDYIHVNYTGFFKTLLKVVKLVHERKGELLHAFDTPSFFYARIVSILNRVPLVLTRCGGENPKNFPYNDEIIVYSIENFNFIKNKNKFKDSNLSLIPNRVSFKKQDYNKIQNIKESLKITTPVILRISRISSVYKKSILQSIELTNLLNDKGIPVTLIIIGYVQEKEAFNELIVYQSENIHFLTQSKFTINASSLIDIADFVVGTGRGFMEASLIGKTMLASTVNMDIPILVSQDKVLDVFKVNFSQRYYEERSRESVLAEIFDAFQLHKSGGVNNLVDFAKENFSSENIYQKHLPVYKRARPARVKFLDLVFHMLVMLKPRHRLRSFLSNKNN